MMKNFFLLLVLSMTLSTISFSQNASTYFPSNTGYKWYYKNTLLDSNNNPTTVITYQVDSFAIVQQYQELLANIVLSKSGLLNINQTGPYLDTFYYNFQGTNAWKYLKLIDIDTLPINIGIINFLRSFEKWYSTYRFAQAVNTNYTIISKDTTIVIDTLTLPLRVSSIGRRLNDQNVITVNGTYLAKKFVITNSLFYLLSIPPFPKIPIPIIQQPDTVWIAENVWVIKEIIPSVAVDLSNFGFKFSFTIPGNLKELTSPSTGIINYPNNLANEYYLFQNYPNPFNPSTKINFDIPKSSFINLTVYNSLGEKIETLVNQTLDAGSYEVDFNGENYSSGIYYYHIVIHSDNLEGNSSTGLGHVFSDVKKMILLK